ncbi:outer membrane protein assembly factor BamB [Aquisalimonas sp.]|uniref:outer membrane protein assembly factor BamB n=1 Tax=Aquisalimonas sp. TaxID=1872621 RepID=UPI0025BA0936|nr:outer membrane protein assembly factor BamB [Aquisalimonas sp.]
MRRLFTLLLTSLVLVGCGASPERTSPADDLRDGQLEVVAEREWHRRASSGVQTHGDALPPVLVDGVIHVADRRGRISAYSAESGRLQWRHGIGEGVSGGPGISDNLAVVGTRKGRVFAVDTDSGETLWEARASSEVLAVPAVGNEIVVVRTADGRAYGFSRDAGSRRWLQDVSVPALSLRGTGNPVIAGDRVLIGFENGQLQAISLGGGSVDWQVTVSEPRGSADLDRVRDVDATPVVFEGTVYVVGYRGDLLALSAERGDVYWDRELSSHAGLDVDAERVYVTDDRGGIWALDRRTGAAIWRQSDTQGLQPTSPAVHGDKVVFGDETGRMTVLSAQDGRILARVRVADADSISQAPVSDGEGVHVLTDNGLLMRYHLRDRDTE